MYRPSRNECQSLMLVDEFLLRTCGLSSDYWPIALPSTGHRAVMASDKSKGDFMRTLANSLEALRNLVFLTRMEAGDAEQVKRYMELAEEWTLSLQKHLKEQCAAGDRPGKH